DRVHRLLASCAFVDDLCKLSHLGREVRRVTTLQLQKLFEVGRLGCGLEQRDGYRELEDLVEKQVAKRPAWLANGGPEAAIAHRVASAQPRAVGRDDEISCMKLLLALILPPDSRRSAYQRLDAVEETDDVLFITAIKVVDEEDDCFAGLGDQPREMLREA